MSGPLPDASHEERRLVTVLFADVVGSTALGESLDPEDVRALLGRLFAAARDAVGRHGGLIEKFIGDAVMAVFGLPVAHDDDAARALMAALDLRDRVRADPVLRDALAIRLGVNTGEVIATTGGEASGPIVVGDAVNTAARLEQGAEPWTILAGERTVHAVSDAFRFGDAIPLAAKGKAQPIIARPLEGVAEPRARRVRRAQRLVGRDADLAQLRLVSSRVLDERRPYLVSVVAPAGVGKTRLLEAFLDGLRADPGDLAPDEPAPLVAIAQCLPYGQQLTYWPLRGITLAILGLGEDAPPDAVRDRLGHWLADAGDAEAAATAESVGATIGAVESDTGDRIALHAAWRRFIELAAHRSPLVLVIEDLHWSSDSLLDLVESILAPQAEVPLLMIALARPELLDRRPTWGGGRRNAVSIALEPLPGRAVEALVRDLLPQPDPAIVAAVVARAEGNPFYAGEIVRSLLDRVGSDLVPADVNRAIAALPDSVHATVLARIDALDRVTRRTVQLASVLGRSFDAPAVTALEPEIRDEVLRQAIESLLDRDFVRTAGGDRYTFRHVLIREVAYGMLPRGERARLHAAAGNWLADEAERTDRTEELAELVAFHFREAVTLRSAAAQDPDPTLTERAVTWLERAASTAYAGAAQIEAARHLEAASALADPRRRAAIEERLGRVWIGGDQALAAFETAYRLGRELDLGPDQALRTYAGAATVRGRWAGTLSEALTAEAAERWIAELAELRAAATEPAALAAGHLAQAFLCTLPAVADSPLATQAAASARQALEFAERSGATDVQSAALDALAADAIGEARHVDALEYSRARLQLPGLVTDERADALNMAAWSLVALGDVVGAEETARITLVELSGVHAPGFQLGASAWRADALVWLGRWDEALAEVGRAMGYWRDSEIETPGFAMNGPFAAWYVARAREDAGEAQHWEEVLRSVIRRMAPGARIRQMEPILDGDHATIRARTMEGFGGGSWATWRSDFVQRTMALLADERAVGHPGPLAELRDRARDHALRVLWAEAERALGIATATPEPLERALELHLAAQTPPSIARVRTELGVLRRDRALVDEGLATLDTLGDVRQMARVEREWREGRLGA